MLNRSWEYDVARLTDGVGCRISCTIFTVDSPVRRMHVTMFHGLRTGIHLRSRVVSRAAPIETGIYH
jgi:hypothetical protein